MKKLLSIIVPTYNMEAYLDKCLSSLIVGEADDELMQCLEVLVVNDGSTDRSSEIAHGYEERYPDTFKVIDKENGNYGSCINAALPVAAGKYIKVLDADDWFDRDVFSLYLNEIKDLDVDVVLTEVRKVHTSGEVFLLNKDMLSEECKVLPWQAIIPFSKTFMFAHHFTYRKQLLLDIDYHQTEGYSYTDNEWVAYPLAGAETVYYCPVILYNYLVGREGQSVSREAQRKSLTSYKSLLLSLGNLWYNYHGNEERKSMLHNILIAQVKDIYVTIALERIVTFSEFRKFDQEITEVLPEIINVSNRIVVGGKHFPMPVFKYYREGHHFLFLLARLRYNISGKRNRKRN